MFDAGGTKGALTLDLRGGDRVNLGSDLRRTFVGVSEAFAGLFKSGYVIVEYFFDKAMKEFVIFLVGFFSAGWEAQTFVSAPSVEVELGCVSKLERLDDSDATAVVHDEWRSSIAPLVPVSFEVSVEAESPSRRI